MWCVYFNFEKGNTKTSDSKLTLNITYYPEFQNVRSILSEFQILLAPDKEHKKVFPEVPIVGFRNGKSLQDYLVRASLPKMDNAGGFEPCGKGTSQVCDHNYNQHFYSESMWVSI